MRISAQFTFWGSLAFALLCIGSGGFGFSSLDASMPDEVLEAARGFAWFWMFLGGIGILFAVLSWLLLRGTFGEMDS